MSNVYREVLHSHWGQTYDVDNVLFELQTGHQHLVIFENKRFGRVMALDGAIQTTQKDEFIYHEMMVHVPLFSHPNPKKVLIIGGGDGGILREVLRHKNVESVTQVEIDGAVIDMCVKYFPEHSSGAYDNPRANIVIDDGFKFVKDCQEKFDVIISDSTDPQGPGEVLFTEDFYRFEKNCLNEGGIMVAQNGVPFMQMGEVINTKLRLKDLYEDTYFYLAAVPTYVGGFMTLAWATDDQRLRNIDINILEQRFSQSGIKTRYYNPAIHKAAFALPQFVLDELSKLS